MKKIHLLLSVLFLTFWGCDNLEVKSINEDETQSFEIDKLLITYETIAGFSIITDIEYDGESIDKGDYSTTTKEISLNVYQNNE